MEWLIPILVLIGVVISLIGNISEKRYASRQGNIPPASPPRIHGSSKVEGSKAQAARQNVEVTRIDAPSVDDRARQTEMLHQQRADDYKDLSPERPSGMNGGLKLRLRGRGLTRAMAMMEVLGPPKARRYMP